MNQISSLNKKYSKEHSAYIKQSIIYEKAKRSTFLNQNESKLYTTLDSAWHKAETTRLELITLMKEFCFNYPILSWIMQYQTKQYKLYFEEYSDQLYKDELDYARQGDKDKLQNMTTDAMRANHFSTLLNEIYVQKSLSYTLIVIGISIFTLLLNLFGIRINYN